MEHTFVLILFAEEIEFTFIIKHYCMHYAGKGLGRR